MTVTQEWLQLTVHLQERLEAIWEARDSREIEDRLRCYLAGLADGQTLAGYCAAKGENTLLREVTRELRGLNYRTVQTESHSNPFLHFVREHTVVLDDQEQEGALATAELVAAYLVIHPNTHRSERSLQMLLNSAVKTVHARPLGEGSIHRSEHLSHTHLQGHLPNGREARGWIGLRLSKVEQEQVKTALAQAEG